MFEICLECRPYTKRRKLRTLDAAKDIELWVTVFHLTRHGVLMSAFGVLPKSTGPLQPLFHGWDRSVDMMNKMEAEPGKDFWGEPGKGMSSLSTVNRDIYDRKGWWAEHTEREKRRHLDSTSWENQEQQAYQRDRTELGKWVLWGKGLGSLTPRGAE